MFTTKTLEFLIENRLHNSKTWFEEHKPDFQNLVVAPLAELVVRLAPALLEIDPELVAIPKVGKCISRVYRDTRFSRDKTLYRDVMWAVFMRDKKRYGGLPGFFFEIAPCGFRYGCGYYQAGGDSMQRIRELILAGDKDFQAAFAAYEGQDRFTLEGELYKTSRHPGSPEALRNWLDRKNICFVHSSTDATLLYAENLPETLATHFALLAPIYRFLAKAELSKK